MQPSGGERELRNTAGVHENRVAEGLQCPGESDLVPGAPSAHRMGSRGEPESFRTSLRRMIDFGTYRTSNPLTKRRIAGMRTPERRGSKQHPVPGRAPGGSKPDACTRGGKGGVRVGARPGPRPGGWLRRALAFGAALMMAAGAVGALAAEYANPTGVALIIGNGDYEHRDVPDVDYAHRDAEAFGRYVVDVLGYNPENVLDLRDATRRELFDALGTRHDPHSLLWSYLDPNEGSDVVVFYSGHGVPGVNDGRGYLLPVDSDPKAAEYDGYPIDLLYRNLGDLAEARSVRVYLDTCFSGGSHGGGLIGNASPVYVAAALPEGVVEKVMSLAAASGKQVASWDEEARHGMFTHHLLNALYGGGDADGDGQVTAVEVKGYLDRYMTRAARRQHRRVQRASLMGAPEVVVASASADGVFPARPDLDASGAASVAVAPEDGGPEEAGGSGKNIGGSERGETASDASDASDAPGDDGAQTSPPSSVGDAESVEKALGLTHAQRVLVQRGLTLLDHDVGVADGVFGRRTRGGIMRYQQEKGLAETGYLTREQFEGLTALGEEAQRRMEAAHRADDEAFARAKSEGTAESYASYLDAYPSGRHVVEARRLRDEVLARGRGPVVGERFRDCDGMWCPELVVVPAGSFRMGSPSSEEGRHDSEGPVHRVRIAQPFAVGVYEVTFAEWDACVRDGGCGGYRPDDEGWGRGRRPVINVSWEDAQSYVGWLSRKTGEKYRLLSESEWEYVARAGTTGAFHFGATISTSRANYDGRYTYSSGRKGGYRGRTVPVGSFPANGFGLHDVHGNVREWVEDCWHADYRGAPSDMSAWTRRGDCGRRVLRGGSWNDLPRILRSALRSRNSTGDRFINLGFRVARTLTP